MWVKAKPVPFLLRLKQKTKILSQSRMAGVKVYYLFSDTTEFYRRVTAWISYADDYYPFVLVSREGFVIMWMNYFSFERIKSCERSCFICKKSRMNVEWRSEEMGNDKKYAFLFLSRLPGNFGTFLSAWCPVHTSTPSYVSSWVWPVFRSRVLTSQHPLSLKFLFCLTLTT